VVSRRTPNGDWPNIADSIERDLWAGGHLFWGLVIFRCTYGDDESWKQALLKLNQRLQERLARHNGLDMGTEERFKLPVIEDTALEEASTHAVRERFEQWCATAEQTEQGTPEEIASRRTGAPSYGEGSSRYRYCLAIDRESLDSITTKPDPGDWKGYGWVKIIDRH